MRRITIERIKDEVPMDILIESLGGRVKGASWSEWAPTHCPFHEDSVASSSVNRAQSRFVCHGCGVSGDVIDIAQHVTGGTLPEAIDWLAKEFHVR